MCTASKMVLEHQLDPETRVLYISSFPDIQGEASDMKARVGK